MHSSINPYVVVVVCSANLSLAAEVMCISVFPGYWMTSPMIHVQELPKTVQELPMTLNVAYINSLSM